MISTLKPFYVIILNSERDGDQSVVKIRINHQVEAVLCISYLNRVEGNKKRVMKGEK